MSERKRKEKAAGAATGFNITMINDLAWDILRHCAECY